VQEINMKRNTSLFLGHQIRHMLSLIKFRTKKYHSKHRLNPGELIQFLYKGKIRTGIVITPEWKGNCDVYDFISLQDVDPKLLQWILAQEEINDGDLYVDFGDTYHYKSFKLKEIMRVLLIPFDESTKRLENTAIPIWS